MDRTPATADATAHAFTDGVLDDQVRLDGEDGHHLQRVRRVRAGERVTLADRDGNWRSYLVAGAGSGVLELQAEHPAHAPTAQRFPIVLVFALTKGDGPETVVARGTELGVDRFEPIITERTVARPDPDRIGPRLERAAREAASQSRRTRVPEIVSLRSLTEAVHDASAAPLVVAALGGAIGLASPGPRGWRLLVGPEGGFSAAERVLLQGRATVGLGPNVLRAVTAALGVAALAATVRTGLITGGPAAGDEVFGIVRPNR